MARTLARNMVKLRMRNGEELDADVETESDGCITIVSPQVKGYRSAHRDHAQKHFGKTVLWRMHHLSWVNDKCTRVALTRWNTQAYRTAKRCDWCHGVLGETRVVAPDGGSEFCSQSCADKAESAGGGK